MGVGVLVTCENKLVGGKKKSLPMHNPAMITGGASLVTGNVLQVKKIINNLAVCENRWLKKMVDFFFFFIQMTERGWSNF